MLVQLFFLYKKSSKLEAETDDSDEATFRTDLQKSLTDNLNSRSKLLGIVLQIIKHIL